jgi:UDP-N-acetylglucosamine 2-epimerase (non-hydrolysing)
MNKLLLIIGTRPEFIKISPLLKILPRNSYKTVFTGQHTTLLSGIEFDYKLEIKDGDNRLDSVVQSCLNNGHVFEDISHIMVQGDTTSAFAMTLSAYHRGIKIIHLEAGLRSHDYENPYPEEMNRCLIGRLADIHLCPTIQNKVNLTSEGIPCSHAYIVGNTCLDNLVDKKDVTYGNKILVTLHRRENHEKIVKWFTIINMLASEHPEYDFIFPMHPNPNVKKYENLLTNIRVVEPIPYESMVEILREVRLVISDSGGLQEECSFLGKKILVCREKTERPESVGHTSFLVSPNTLKPVFYDHVDVPKPSSGGCPFGDGNSSKLILEVLKREGIL